MYSDHFNLFGLLEFVARSPKLFGERRIYGEKVKELLKEVPNNRGGWYLWGRFNNVGWWETVYLGKADKGKTSSLNTRLSDELREEAIWLWAYVYGREDPLRQFRVRYGDRYDKNVKRSLRKTGAQFVIWVSAPKGITKDKIFKQEKTLIRIFRPTHNTQRGRHLKADKMTKEIERQIEKELTKMRGVIY